MSISAASAGETRPANSSMSIALGAALAATFFDSAGAVALPLAAVGAGGTGGRPMEAVLLTAILIASPTDGATPMFALLAAMLIASSAEGGTPMPALPAAVLIATLAEGGARICGT